MIAAGGEDRLIKVWHAVGHDLQTLRTDSPVTALAFDAKAAALLAGHWDGSLTRWEVKSASRAFAVRHHAENITAIALSGDGKQIATGSGDDTCRLVDAANGKELQVLDQGNDYDVTCVAFSPDGKWVATGDGDNQVQLWSTAAGERLQSLGDHEAAITGVIFARDGKRLVSASSDHSVRLWDLSNGREQRTYGRHRSEVTCFSPSPDGKFFATATADKIVQVWKLDAAEPIVRLKVDAAASSLALSSDARQVVIGISAKILYGEIR
jgi:WD40 repeat protein